MCQLVQGAPVVPSGGPRGGPFANRNAHAWLAWGAEQFCQQWAAEGMYFADFAIIGFFLFPNSDILRLNRSRLLAEAHPAPTYPPCPDAPSDRSPLVCVVFRIPP